MSNYEEELVASFRSTVRAFTKYKDLIRATNKMVDNTLVYFENFSVINKRFKQKKPVISVTADTTFHCASQYAGKGKRVAVLNFANAYHPGGGVEVGSTAQEECLCRSSNLYAALTCNYVLTNYYDRNSRNRNRFGHDSIVYSKGVTVFKSDELIPQKLETPFTVDVITCAAPYYNKHDFGTYNEARYKDVFYVRIKNILEVAISNGVDVLVLGAFGCGAFHNPPDLVARVFRKLLIDERYACCFKTVVFAIKPHGKNYDAFRDVLHTGGGDKEPQDEADNNDNTDNTDKTDNENS